MIETLFQSDIVCLIEEPVVCSNSTFTCRRSVRSARRIHQTGLGWPRRIQWIIHENMYIVSSEQSGGVWTDDFMPDITLNLFLAFRLAWVRSLAWPSLAWVYLLIAWFCCCHRLPYLPFLPALHCALLTGTPAKVARFFRAWLAVINFVLLTLSSTFDSLQLPGSSQACHRRMS